MTKTLLIGTGICLVAQRDPIQTAKQVASIDQVSGGRFLFGIGNGWNEDEIPDPETIETFQRSKLNWSEVHEGQHAEMLQWVKDLR